ncbi:MAG TPA: NAD(P)-dependent oxidoreductase [Polyangia bacterium]|nr:NAD(P)-dependent oxidoreductase [Polyangia bacterium]
MEPRGNPFQEIKPALALDAALAEASRCLFCFDAPCTRACPTHIDVPAFIKKIATGNLRGSARTILDANVLGASCARVCPTEVLCEGACVMDDLHWKPIKIGQLQRHATDWAMRHGMRPFTAGPRRAGRAAIIGGGPAGLACAAELLKLGYEAVVYDAAKQPGGLNTSGVAEYKMTPEFSLREVGWLVEAGVQIKSGVRIGADVSLDELERQFDAIFVGVGLGRIGRLGIPGDELDGVVDAIDFIAALKLDRPHARAGRRVVVIGGGNTAIDAVTQAQRLGAEEVTLVYRRGPDEMPAYKHEVQLARESGCRFVYLHNPSRILGRGKVEAIELQRMRLGAPDASGRRKPEPAGGDPTVLTCDLVIPATGQQPRSELLESLPNVRLDRGRVAVDERTMQTSNPRYFAGGDCVSGGQEVVNAVAEGKRAAAGIAAYIESRREVSRG